MPFVFVAVCALAVGRALTAAPDPDARRLDEAARIAVSAAAAAEEPAWRIASRRSFPEDHWSQDDDFAASERRWAIDEARRRRVPVSEVFRAIDEDLHRSPPVPPRRATSSPTKPRPFYD